MTGRSRPEWVASSPDAKIPREVRARIFLRDDGVCHISKRKIRPGEAWEAEHLIPLWKGGEHRESNLAPALVDAHREKTAAEAGDRAKAKRLHAKHHGYWPESKSKIRSRGFQPSRASHVQLRRD